MVIRFLNFNSLSVKSNNSKISSKLQTILCLFLLFYPQIYSQQWQWQNPLPTGNNLNDIKFIDEDTGWFVGNNGTIFKTTNGGKNWDDQSYSPLNNYISIHPRNKEIVWLLSETKIFISSDGGRSWVENYSLPDSVSYRLQNISFISDEVGWVAGCYTSTESGLTVGGLLLKTTNSGSTWQIISNTAEYGIEKIQFLNDSLGFFCGGTYYNSLCDDPFICHSYSHGYIYKTTDAGINWEVMFRDTIIIWDFYFKDGRGWATGSAAWDEGSISKSSDYLLKMDTKSENWNIHNLHLDKRIKHIIFNDDMNGWAVGIKSVIKTSDGGSTWDIKYPLNRDAHLSAACLLNNGNGFIIGTEGVILTSTDGGESWEHKDKKFISGSMWKIYFVNKDKGWFTQGDDFRLFKTIDKGKNWIDQDITGVYAMDFSDNENGWLTGINGKVLHSNDGGDTWLDQNSGTYVFLKDVEFINSKTGWATGDGTIIKTKDGGATWLTQLETNQKINFQKIVIQDSLRVWILGYGGDKYTSDGGNSWAKNDSVTGLFFLNKDSGWAKIGYDLCFTEDGGNTWGIIGERSVSFYDTYLVNLDSGWQNSGSHISFTKNGGYDWTLLFKSEVGHPITDMNILDAKHGWVIGSGGHIIRYGYPDDVSSVYDIKTSTPGDNFLFHNYPNPFNSSTTISYKIYEESIVKITIYDILGREVKVLTNEQLGPGIYKKNWDGRDESGNIISSGVYFCRINVSSIINSGESFLQTQKFILLK